MELYRIKTDGSAGRELLGTIEAGDIHMSYLCLYNNKDYIYTVMHCSTENEEEMKLYEYSIETGTFAQKMSERGIVDYTMKRDEQGKLTAIEGNGFEGNDLNTVAFDNDRNMYIYKGVTGEVFCYRLDTGECTKIYDNDGYGNVIHYDDGCLYLDYITTGMINRQYKMTVIDTEGNLIEEIDCGKADKDYACGKEYIFMKKSVGSELRKNSDGKDITDEYVLYNRNTGEYKVILEGTAF